jgi:hypothetical protein
MTDRSGNITGDLQAQQIEQHVIAAYEKSVQLVFARERETLQLEQAEQEGQRLFEIARSNVEGSQTYLEPAGTIRALSTPSMSTRSQNKLLKHWRTACKIASKDVPKRGEADSLEDESESSEDSVSEPASHTINSIDLVNVWIADPAGVCASVSMKPTAEGKRTFRRGVVVRSPMLSEMLLENSCSLASPG